jgi:putative SOS response-associated peptidase YedK
MCGRFMLSSPPAAVAERFGLPEPPDLFGRYNVAPTQLVAVVGDGPKHGRRLALFRWGLVPAWSPEGPTGPPLINARAETVATKPTFRELLRHRRCLIPADGFYEWAKAGGKKLPYLFRLRGCGPFAFAGLWDVWEGPNGKVPSCCVITTTANELVAPLHDRMPVVLPPDQFGLWLDRAVTDPAALLPLLVPYPADLMTATAVNPRVNNARNEGPECVEPAA